MRKYDKRNKIYMGIVLIASLILIIIFSFFIAKVIKNGKIEYYVDAGSILYDKDKNLIRLEDESVLKIKWNDEYYLMENKNMYMLGNKGVIFNPSKQEVVLYGKYYEVTAAGEDKVLVYEDETIVKTTESRFLKMADRKYLIIDPVISTDNGNLNTKNYLIIELDKTGNAVLLNNEINMKTFEPTTIITSNFVFDIANETLTISDQIIDLKKIIGSTNEYVKPEEEKPNGSGGSAGGSGTGDGTGEGDGTGTGGSGGSGGGAGGSGTGDGTGEGDGTGTGGSGGSGGGAGGSGTGDGTGEGNGTGTGGSGGGSGSDDETIEDIIQNTKTTSIISVNPSVGSISIDYVIYDPLDEYESVFVEVRDDNGTLTSVGYFDKMNTNFIITGLKANIRYNLVFKYVYYNEDGVRQEVAFDDAVVTVGKPTLALKIDKITSDTIYYTVILDEDYTLDKIKVNLVSTLEDGTSINLSSVFNEDALKDQESVSGAFTYENIGKYVTLSLSDIIYSGYNLDMDVRYKFVMK